MPVDMTIAGVVLAGGLSRRMGKPKAMVRAGGKTLVERVVACARPQVGALLLNVNDGAADLAHLGLPVRADAISGFAGPLAGILAGLDWARDELHGVTWVASFPVDTPLLPTDLVESLRQAVVGADAEIGVAASGGRAHHVIGLWPVRLADALRHALESEGLRKVERWTERYKVALREWPSGDDDPFFNVNTPADLEVLEARLDPRRLP